MTTETTLKEDVDNALKLFKDYGANLGYAAEIIRRQQDEVERLEDALSQCEVEARRYAKCYPKNSDGRNTFELLANRIVDIADGKLTNNHASTRRC